MKQVEGSVGSIKHIDSSQLDIHDMLAISPVGKATLLALIIGLLIIGLYFSPVIATMGIAAIGVGVPILWLVWHHPEYGLLGLIFLTSSFIRPDTIDLRLPIGGLDLRDLVLLGMLGMLLLQRLMQKELRIPWWPVSGPLFVFLGLAIFSALYALLYQVVEPNWVFSELRPLIYYTVLFMTAWAITRPTQLIVLVIGLFLLADLTAGLIILQQFFGRGDRLLAAMWGSSGGWQVFRAGDPSIGFGAVRIIPPGHILVFMMSIMAICLMMFVRRSSRLSFALALQFAYLNIGLVFTYTRAQWVASIVALGAVFILLPASDKYRLIRSLIFSLPILLFIYIDLGGALSGIWNHMPFVQTLVLRALSILTPGETLDTFSLQWRIFEAQEALRSIVQHPLLGVGLGNAYRDITLLQGEAHSGYFRLIRYVHSSYLYLAVKMGLPGLISFLWICIAFLVNGLRAYVGLSDKRYKSIVLAMLASFIGVLAWSVFHSHFMLVESATVIGFMVGVVASIRHISETAWNRSPDTAGQHHKEQTVSTQEA